jgi:hypothetical protein
MGGSIRKILWSPWVLSLILIAANVGAPFRTSALGRVLLQNLRRNPATSSTVRVRAVSASGASQGYRAIVGLARGGSDELDPAANPRALSGFLRSSTATHSQRHDDRPIARPHPFLRC